MYVNLYDEYNNDVTQAFLCVTWCIIQKKHQPND